MSVQRIIAAAIFAVFSIASVAAVATETENSNLRILPAQGKVAVDGKVADWDLSAGLFACGDVETAAGTYAVWLHAMYDAENLYILARWIDPTPMNNPGSIKGDYGFKGDCLQFRIVTAANVDAPEVANRDQKSGDAPEVRTTHATCWRDRDGLDVIDLEFGRKFNEGKLKDAKTSGAQQAFAANADGKGYIQEIALPWKMITKEGQSFMPKAGARILLTFEPNFTIGESTRLTIKDHFKPGITPDRVFTFQGNTAWGYATLVETASVEPRPVRLADGREFAVRMEAGSPVVDWTGLARSQLPDGFKPIKVNVAQDGYVSLNIFAPDGTVARQLLMANFLKKGEHEILWDGLTTPSAHRPGTPVAAGTYTWEAITHPGIGLKLRGWAANSGDAPWRGWGADHGNPVAAAADPVADRIYLGWGAGEGDKPLQAVDSSGKILWKNIRGGIAGAGPIATDGKTVYIFNPVKGYAARAMYRIDAATGNYTDWSAYKNTDLSMKDLWDQVKDHGLAEIPEYPAAIAAGGGKVFISFNKVGAILAVDANTGTLIKKIDLKDAGAMALHRDGRLFVAAGPQIVLVNVEDGTSKPVARLEMTEKDWLAALAIDRDGDLYAGVRGDTQQIFVFSADGKPLRTIGRKGGRALAGPWTPDGVYNVHGLAVDGNNQLWVAEDDGNPRRVSVWDAKTGAFKTEYFGATAYGATGGAINPRDVNLMVGQGCEWRLNPQTGKAACVGTITREGMGACRFGESPAGRQYLAVTPAFLHGPNVVHIYERLGDGQYKKRSTLREVTIDGAPVKGKPSKSKRIEVWADANDDAVEQPDEVKTFAMDLGGWLAGWYMPMTPDLTFYGSLFQVKVTGWSACGAPIYDLAQAKHLPAPADVRIRGGGGAQRGHGSVDGRYMLYNAGYGLDHGTVDCYDLLSGKLAWTYPSNFTGVHGSHRAIPSETGMMRGAYDIVGAARFPAPIGNLWVIPTNKGEWHILTERGFYLTRLFEGDPTRMAWPDNAAPGANLDHCPPGSGEEAFGGSIVQSVDGKLSVQAGHTSFWNIEVTGLDKVTAIKGGTVTIAPEDIATAEAARGRQLQQAAGPKRLAIAKASPAFTGDLDKDFAAAEVIKYSKGEATAIRSAAAYDDKQLYVAWDVKDPTPWVNGADAPEFMYSRGDTVDLQLATNPNAPKARREATLGDMRISIGSFQGQPTVVVYRKESREKNPKSFSSGVQKGYQMDSVTVLKEATVKVSVNAKTKRYVVEAALPLAVLELKPAPALVLKADFGATHSDAAGKDTILRTHWANQDTGLVSDEVFELKMTPANWGEIVFKGL